MPPYTTLKVKSAACSGVALGSVYHDNCLHTIYFDEVLDKHGDKIIERFNIDMTPDKLYVITAHVKDPHEICEVCKGCCKGLGFFDNPQ